MISHRTLRFVLVLTAAFAVGAFLRLHALSSQILLDDEWHSIIQVTGRNYVEVLTRFNPHDNSSLLQALYNLALYRSFGWTEFTLRLPMVLAGLASLILLPLLVRNLFNDRVALIFSGLLAISPFLIFYSRYARAYEFMMLLGFSFLLLFHQWLTTRKLRYAAGFTLAGISAIYAHLFSLVAVFAPLVLMIGFKLTYRVWPRFPTGRPIVASGKALCVITLVILLALLPLIVPVLRQSSQLPWGMGKPTWQGVITAATLLSGTANCPLSILFFLLCVLGLGWLFRCDALLGWIFLSAVGAYLVVLLISRPLGLDIGAILLRYMIVTVPVALTLAALGLEKLLAQGQSIKRIPRGLPILAITGFIGCLYATGPFTTRLGLRNNFENHMAFQGSYRSMTWERSNVNTVYPSFSVAANQIPPFYHWLAGQTNVETIIEYPFDICDYNDLFYYFQHFHQKGVLVGYVTNPSLPGYGYDSSDLRKSRFIPGMLCADAILSPVTDPTKLKFRNMVDVSDRAALSRCGANFIILHKYVMALKIIPGGAKAAQTFGTVRVYYRSVLLLAAAYQKTFGPAVYEDEQIVCFWLN